MSANPMKVPTFVWDCVKQYYNQHQQQQQQKPQLQGGGGSIGEDKTTVATTNKVFIDLVCTNLSEGSNGGLLVVAATKAGMGETLVHQSYTFGLPKESLEVQSSQDVQELLRSVSATVATGDDASGRTSSTLAVEVISTNAARKLVRKQFPFAFVASAPPAVAGAAADKKEDFLVTMSLASSDTADKKNAKKDNMKDRKAKEEEGETTEGKGCTILAFADLAHHKGDGIAIPGNTSSRSTSGIYEVQLLRKVNVTATDNDDEDEDRKSFSTTTKLNIPLNRSGRVSDKQQVVCSRRRGGGLLAPGEGAAFNLSRLFFFPRSSEEEGSSSSSSSSSSLRPLDNNVYEEDEDIFLVWPEEFVIPVNVASKSEVKRRALHKQLLLPNRPLLAVCDDGSEEEKAAMTMATITKRLISTCVDVDENGNVREDVRVVEIQRNGEAWENKVVRNIHEHMKPNHKKQKDIEGASVALVTGNYDYYHYRIDGFCDDGWGCAYRSLQTVLSWFQYMRIIPQSPMPSVKGIQEILYKVDPDKENKKNFVGSKDWIGSFEVMLVLQYFVPGIECAIRRLEHGKELEDSPDLQNTLLRHFKTSGCPVMIGGHGYAHTILGIEVNPLTAQAHYLVLDPHYSTNTTDVKVALNKGWCGWKKASEFFSGESWYNLCIPKVDEADFS